MNRESTRTHRMWSLLGVFGAAVAQPVYDVLGKSPEYFVIMGVAQREVLLFSMVTAVVLPLLLWGIVEGGYGLSTRIGRLLNTFILFSLFLTFCLPLGMKAGIQSFWALTVSATGAASVLTLLAVIPSPIASFFPVIGYLSLLFPLFFIFRVRGSFDSSAVSFTPAVQEEGKSSSPTIVLVFDEFPLAALITNEGKINAERFPGFAKLASMSTWFQQGSTVTSWTERAVPTILTGKYPLPGKKQMPSLRAHPENLFTLLSQSHEVRGYEQVTHLCPPDVCALSRPHRGTATMVRTLLEDGAVLFLYHVLPSQYRYVLPEVDRTWGGFLHEENAVKKGGKGFLEKGEWSDDDALFELFLRSIEEYPSTERRPPLHFLHITFPHVPYRMLPNGKKYLRDVDSTNDKGYKKNWSKEDKWPATLAMERFLLQAGFADGMINRLLEKLEQKNILEKSLLVVVADHGTSFQLGEFSRRVSAQNFTDVMGIPFFVKRPGQVEGTIVDRNVETVDVVPTILAENGLRSSVRFDGSAAFSDAPLRELKTFFPLEGEVEKLTFPPRLALAQSAALYTSVFGEGGFDERFFAIGPRSNEFTGRKVDEVRNQLEKRTDFIFYNLKEYEAVSLTDEFLPVWITGRCPVSVLKAGSPIAISVNAVIAGTTLPVAGKENDCRFSVMIPPSFLKEGKNSLHAFLLK